MRTMNEAETRVELIDPALAEALLKTRGFAGNTGSLRGGFSLVDSV